MARDLRSQREWRTLLAPSVEDAGSNSVDLIAASMVGVNTNMNHLLIELFGVHAPRIWLVKDTDGRLCGVLIPFELM